MTDTKNDIKKTTTSAKKKIAKETEVLSSDTKAEVQADDANADSKEVKTEEKAEAKVEEKIEKAKVENKPSNGNVKYDYTFLWNGIAMD